VRPFTTLTGRAVPLDRADVDTDQIIPAVYLKRVERSGFGPFLFDSWRSDPSFVLNRPEHEGATILVTGPNFGGGSSREHAVWALEDHGFRAIVAPSFADIFRNNCTKVGLLPVELPEPTVRTLLETVTADPATEITVDLRDRRVTAPGVDAAFEIDDFTRWRLLEGLDDIGLTLRHEDEITAFERDRPGRLPSVAMSPFSGT
jgi:3-isopropylmalate/(R)-2-methylmalate dehydratase small subunit